MSVALLHVELSNQLGLFDTQSAPQRLQMPKARARRSDPMTSAQAAESHQSAKGEQMRIVLDAVKRWPGSTATELAMNISTATRYLPAAAYEQREGVA